MMYDLIINFGQILVKSMIFIKNKILQYDAIIYLHKMAVCSNTVFSQTLNSSLHNILDTQELKLT